MTTTTTGEETGVRKGGIGDRVPRFEDEKFLTGQGEFLGDVRRPELLHIAILRSPYAHARIRSVDVTNAVALPGVIGAFAGREVAEFSQAFHHHLPMIPSLKQIQWYPLAHEKARFVGEPIAAVVAESRYIAEDALELIEVDYEELPAVSDAEAGLAPDAPRLYDDWDDNVFLFLPAAGGDVEQAFAHADGVVEERFTQHRICGFPMEGHGALGEYDAATGRLTVWASTQGPHNLRTVIADITGLHESKVRVVSPDMGGGFGNKAHFIREESLVALLAIKIQRPVVWQQDRVENLTAGVHSRQQVHEVATAYRNDGRVLGVKAKIIADCGNPEIYYMGASPAVVTTSLMTGTYDIQDYACELYVVATSKATMGGYRGYGQPQANFSIERMMDLVAERLDMDPADIRRINMIPDEPRPYVSPTGALYDTGSLKDQFEELLEKADYAGLRRKQTDARAEGRLVGVGLASLVEPTAPNIHALAGRFGGYEMASLTVQPDGHVNIALGTKSQGQGHQTVFAQVAADTMGISVDQVEVRDGDTDAVPYGMGTWGSRSAVMAGGAVIQAADRMMEKMSQIAAHILQGDPADTKCIDGMFHVGEAAIPFSEVASAAYLHTFLLPAGMDMGLSVVAGYDPGNTSPFPDEKGHLNVAATYATAAAAAFVEVDRNTGKVAILDFTLVHDCGVVINPLMLDGQLQGAFAQAVGSVLFEELNYNADGQPQNATMLDYSIPAFGDVPRPTVIHRETPSPLVGGFRGAGEGATIVSPSAIANAIHDALRPLGVKVTQTNLGPNRLRDLMRASGVEIDPLAGIRFRGVAGTR
jgi:carbon-monoxide dehydrogenase large subunit